MTTTNNPPTILKNVLASGNKIAKDVVKVKTKTAMKIFLLMNLISLITFYLLSSKFERIN